MVVDLSDVVFLGECVADTLQQLALVALVVEQHGVRLVAVAAGTPSLLEIGFDRVGTVDVDHHADVGLVDAHAEGVGRHHHAYLVLLPRLLALVLVGGVEAGMVEGGADAGSVEQVRYLLGTAAAAHVDDGRSFHIIQYMQQLVALVGGRADDVGQVAALERHAEDALLGKGQPLLNVVDDGGRGRRRQCQHGHVGQVVADVGYREVRGAEVVAPL